MSEYHMNITFLIGNGYDMNIGLKTGYQAFLEWYIAQESANDIISDFKLRIGDNLKTWSDLEFTLGQMTSVHPLNRRKAFLSCKRDLDLHLKKYIKEQNARVGVPSDADIKSFRKSLIYFSELCSAEVRESLAHIYETYSWKTYTYNVIDFNFTDTVDIFWDRIPDNISWHEWIYQYKSKWYRRKIIDKKGSFIHIHGTLDNTMMTGVNDIDQIANERFREIDEIVDCCVKPAMNYNCKNGMNRFVRDLIKNTNIFVVFGMSIGATDARWWRKVVNRLLSYSDAFLVIVNYDRSYDPTLPYSSSSIGKEIVSNLLKVSECPEEYEKIVKERVCVLLNTNLFYYESLLAEGEK